uniref:Platelet-derived growth factor receptor-like protein n=1 Tax=Ascaris lumbricoides TaxID=6252 RepID=A0A0M3ICZ8_ASCLU
MRSAVPLYLLCVAVLVGAISLVHRSGNAIDDWYEGDAYVQLYEGDSFSIECRSNDEHIEFAFPDNNAFSTGYAGKEEIYNRTHQHAIDGGLAITIDSVKKYDTGNYECSARDNSTSIYLFVATNDKSIFLNEHPIFIAVDLNKQMVEIPCRTDRFIHDTSRVRLLINGRKSALKRTYDSRKGFLLETASLRWPPEVDLLRFTCRYNGSESTVIAVPERSEEKFTMHADRWPYAGSPLRVSCSLKPATHNYEIIWRCPRCTQVPSAVSKRYERTNGGMMHVLVVDELSQEDSGVYECVRVRRSDGKAVEGRQHNITVSKTRGQMRVLNISKSPVEITEGESIEIFVDVDIYPASEYEHRWYKVR